MPENKNKDPKDVRRVYRWEQKDHSPYWAWGHRMGRTDEFGAFIEPLPANVDQLSEKSESEDTEEMAAIKHVINSGGLDKLSVRQRRAFKLVLLQGLTYAQAARRMGISAMTVHEHVKAAGKKIRKLCEDLL